MSVNAIRFCMVILFLSTAFRSFALDPAPVEQHQFERLTTHDEIMADCRLLAASDPAISFQVIGQSAGGKDIPALLFSRERFGSRRQDVPMVMVFCQQHGDEPSGTEAALMLARSLLGEDRELLDHLDLILIPQVNPDGGETRKRRNGNDVDLNRDHVLLSQPETRALHDLFRKWRPEVTLDVHEFQGISRWWRTHGFVREMDVMLGTVTNPLIDEWIHRFSRDVILSESGEAIEKSGFRFHEYVVGSPFEGDRMRRSTVAIDDGRQSFGILGTLSFILEGKRFGDPDNRLKHRTRAQLVAIRSFLMSVAGHAEEIRAGVWDVRQRMMVLPDAGERAPVRVDHGPDPREPAVQLPVLILDNWEVETRSFEPFHGKIQIKRTVSYPIAYHIPASETELIKLLQRHGIAMDAVDQPKVVSVERYRILHVSTRTEEELEMPELDLVKVRETETIQPGDILVDLNQSARDLLVLLLEPESSFGVLAPGGDHSFDRYLKAGIFPVTRIMGDGTVSTNRE